MASLTEDTEGPATSRGGGLRQALVYSFVNGFRFILNQRTLGIEMGSPSIHGTQLFHRCACNTLDKQASDCGMRKQNRDLHHRAGHVTSKNIEYNFPRWQKCFTSIIEGEVSQEEAKVRLQSHDIV